jgi:hypothetical protein
MKLPAPVENEHHAFCCRGCYVNFYRFRCLVCEDQMKRKREGQRLKSGHIRCYNEYRRFPHVYDLPGRTAPKRDERARSAHFTGLKTGLAAIRAPAHVLAVEVWGGCDWHPAISGDGVASEVVRLRPRVLREAAELKLPRDEGRAAA